MDCVNRDCGACGRRSLVHQDPFWGLYSWASPHPDSGCDDSDADEQALPSEVSPAQASQMQASGALILDVREQDEWDAGHVEGATLIPLGELANRLSELPQDTQIIVMCKSGNRSAKGRDLLLANGFTQVTSLAGGITAWIEAGLPTVTGK